MVTTSSEKKLATDNTDALYTAPALIVKPRKGRLVARWLTDENSKLYCQWFIED